MLELDKVYHGDAFDLVKQLGEGTVNLVICSPPYFQQRNYTDSSLEVGREETVDLYVDRLLSLFRSCLDATAADGSLVWNLGDKYERGSLLLAPYRFAIEARKHAMLVNNITWVKTNPTPRQYRRRMVSSTEPFFHFTKSADYYYNVPEEHVETPAAKSNIGQGYYEQIAGSSLTDAQKALARKELEDAIAEVRAGAIPGFRMKISGVHRLPFGGQEGGRKTQMMTKGFTLIKLRGRKIERDVLEFPVETIKGMTHPAIYPRGLVAKLVELLTRPGDLVFDPFVGSGTTAVVCKELNRRYIGFELNEEFARLARERLA